MRKSFIILMIIININMIIVVIRFITVIHFLLLRNINKMTSL